jgi:ribosomal protein S18 acetylase RimI-like enzyme
VYRKTESRHGRHGSTACRLRDYFFREIPHMRGTLQSSANGGTVAFCKTLLNIGSCSMAFAIRRATPADAEFLGWVILTAARGHLSRGWFDIVLERDEDFCLAYCARLAAAEARSWWHWSLFSVAEVDRKPASALCGFGDESVYMASGAAMEEASHAMGLTEAEQGELWPRGSFILSCTTSEHGAWTIENVATLPEHRGTGITQALLEHEFERARQAGFKRAQISFLIGNEPAERAYRNAGFTFAEEKRAPEFEAAMGVPGLRRLARDT